MTTLIAKPVVKDQYWVITDGEKKVGNVIADGNGFGVKLNGVNTHFKTVRDVHRTTQIEFQNINADKSKIETSFAQYPTTAKVFNSILDIRRKIHLYTKTQKSKCYYAAGWYVMKQSETAEVVFCPKYIFIQRYPYAGPFKTDDEAKIMINSV